MTRQPKTVLPAAAPADAPITVEGPDTAATADDGPARDYFPPPRELRGNLGGWTYPAVFLVAILATFLLAQSVLAVGSEQALLPAFYLSAAVFSASFLPMLSAISRGRSRMRIEGARFASDDGTLVLRRSLGYEIAVVISCIALAVCCTIFGIGARRGELTLPVPVPSWAALTVAVLIVAYLVVHAARRDRRRLVLTPLHIVVPSKISVGNRISWTEIDDIAVVSHNNVKGIVALTTPGRRAERPARKRIHAEKLSIGSAATYWLIRFYHEHPQLRAELADHRAAERLRRYAVLDPLLLRIG